ncbi:MAG: RNA polymerase sigma factor [Lachnospiraceae bacterium]|nr:RNA polymerase sigma factor [Lachnospiraceae bacterium]
MEKINSKETLIRLIDQYQNLIFSVCLKMTGDYFAAEDLTQETFLSAYRHLHNGPPEAEKAWLCRIAANKCIDYCRAAARKVIPMEEEIHTLEDPGKKEPLQQVLNSEILEELRSCCNALPPPYREVALAHFLEGKSAREIAEESRTGVNTVKTRINRAREKLKKIYRKELLQE